MKGDTRSLGYSSYIDNLEKLLIPVKLAWITALSSQLLNRIQLERKAVSGLGVTGMLRSSL